LASSSRRPPLGDDDRTRAAQYPRQQHRAHLPGDADDAALFENKTFRDEVLAKIKLGASASSRN